MQKNFTDKAKDFKQILDMWLQRDLSLIGKITILKSLAFSKIIYQCGVITPPPDFIAEIKNLAYGFVWNHKPDKIKRETLIANYNKGGLKMLDLDSFIQAQKTMWVKRFLTTDDASWKAFLNLNLEDLLGKDTFKCTMDCKEQPVNFPNFYWLMLKTWFGIKKTTNQIINPLDVRRECLWLNENIKVNKKQIKWKLWNEKGINQIHDIVNSQGQFLTVTEIEQKYNLKCNFLSYNKLKDAIQNEWRKILKTMKVVENTISFDEQIHIKIGKNFKPINTLKNKEIYWILIDKKQQKPIIIDKYKREMGIHEEKWEMIFSLPKIIRDTKIRTFQYKLLYILTPCNNYLKRIKKSETDRCHWCPEIDDTAHYFAECKHLSGFWASFAQWYAGMTNKKLNLTLENIIVGVLNKDKGADTLNACLLLAKWHIYKQKLDQQKIFFYKFLCQLKYYIKTERTIAIRSNQPIEYLNTWQIVEEYLT
jgi:hypothetical protein